MLFMQPTDLQDRRCTMVVSVAAPQMVAGVWRY